MCSNESLSKDAKDAYGYLDSLAENSQAWQTKDISEQNQLLEKYQNRGGLIKLGKTKDIAA